MRIESRPEKTERNYVHRCYRDVSILIAEKIYPFWTSLLVTGNIYECSLYRETLSYMHVTVEKIT